MFLTNIEKGLGKYTNGNPYAQKFFPFEIAVYEKIR